MTAVDEVLKRAVAQGDIPGVVALATDAAGTIYEGAFGHRALGGAAPMRLDTVFWIASMTKALTACCCMQLVEQGRLDLDAPMGDLLPALATPRLLLGFDDAGQPCFRPATRPITLRHLLTHTSGFAYGMWHAEMARWESWTGIPRHETFLDAARCAPLAFEPGTGWAYGVGIDWAGRAVEAVTGQSLDDYMRAHLLGPLGMHDTGFLLGAETGARLAAMHRRGPDGGLGAIDFTPSQNPAHFSGGGGMFGTGPDYLRFIRMMLNGGTLDGVRALQPETVALMAGNHMGIHEGVSLAVQPMRSAMPALTNDVDLFPAITKHWGLSFLITPENVPGGRRAGSLAWAGLHNTYYWIDPASGLGGVLLTQVLPFADPAVLSLLDDFERAVYSA